MPTTVLLALSPRIFRPCDGPVFNWTDRGCPFHSLQNEYIQISFLGISVDPDFFF